MENWTQGKRREGIVDKDLSIFLPMVNFFLVLWGAILLELFIFFFLHNFLEY